MGFMLSLITVVYDDIIHGASEASQAGEGLVHTAVVVFVATPTCLSTGYDAPVVAVQY